MKKRILAIGSNHCACGIGDFLEVSLDSKLAESLKAAPATLLYRSMLYFARYDRNFYRTTSAR
jgi:hypothetical protein